MAIHGIGKEYDVTFKCDGNMKTTTSQYKVVAMVPGTTGNADWTVQLCGYTGTAGDATASSLVPIGINQSYLSSSSESCDVRLFGLSKATCAESITAGEFVKAAYGAAASSTVIHGNIAAIDSGNTSTVFADTTVTSSHGVCLGRAMEDGSTGTVITIFINPSLYESTFM